MLFLLIFIYNNVYLFHYHFIILNIIVLGKSKYPVYEGVLCITWKQSLNCCFMLFNHSTHIWEKEAQSVDFFVVLQRWICGILGLNLIIFMGFFWFRNGNTAATARLVFFELLLWEVVVDRLVSSPLSLCTLILSTAVKCVFSYNELGIEEEVILSHLPLLGLVLSN